jgi:hypothetical protein
MPWKKGQCGNPKGAGPGRPKIADSMVLLDIKQAARAHCNEAIERLAEHMRSKDERVSMLACIAMIERGYGKPEQRSDSAVVHKFAVVPEVMEEAEWLERRGQPKPRLLPPPDDDPERELN